jgi:hypothetical protein
MTAKVFILIISATIVSYQVLYLHRSGLNGRRFRKFAQKATLLRPSIAAAHNAAFSFIVLKPQQDFANGSTSARI